MRNLLEYPITPEEVIEHLKSNVELERLVAGLAGDAAGDIDPLCAKTALAVVRAALIIVKNDAGSSAAELLEAAFNSQNVPVREAA